MTDDDESPQRTFKFNKPKLINERMATIAITVFIICVIWLLILFTYNIVVNNNICCQTYNTSIVPSIKFGSEIDFNRVFPFWNRTDPYRNLNASNEVVAPEPLEVVKCDLIQSRHTDGFLCLFSGLNLTLSNRNFIPESDIPSENITEINYGGAQGSRIQILTPDVCDEFRNISFYYAYNLELVDIENGTFSNCTNLQTLYLDNNNLTFLSPDLFMRNPNLVWIDLSNNRLMTLPLGIFKRNVLLTGLELDGNLITEFNVRKMRTLRLLKRLWLQNNQIKDFDIQETARKFPGLAELFMCNNQGMSRQNFDIARVFLGGLNIVTDYENCP